MSTVYLNLEDKRVWTALSMQFAVLVSFGLYTLFLYHLPTLWDGKTTRPTSPTGANPRQYPTDPLAIDVWFALALPAVCDAVATVATFNRSVIDHWHYFISVRMTAFAAIVSVLVAMSVSGQGTTPYALQYPAAALLAACGLYFFVGACLDTFHRPPPTISANTRFWTLREYTISLSRTPGTWRSAILSTCVTGGLGTVLTVLVPRSWSALIPIITTGFEVSKFTRDFSWRRKLTWLVPRQAVFLRINGFGRSARYSLCSAPVFQAGVCVHWGLKQVISAPRLSIAPWIFVVLVICGRLFLDLHMRTIFRRYPEFQWAREHALLSTGTLVQLCMGLLLLEELHVPVTRWVKPITVLVFYSLGAVGVSSPAVYLIAFGKLKERVRAAAEGTLS